LDLGREKKIKNNFLKDFHFYFYLRKGFVYLIWWNFSKENFNKPFKELSTYDFFWKLSWFDSSPKRLSIINFRGPPSKTFPIDLFNQKISIQKFLIFSLFCFLLTKKKILLIKSSFHWNVKVSIIYWKVDSFLLFNYRTIFHFQKCNLYFKGSLNGVRNQHYFHS
jgi:hypothetical protein